MWQRKVFFVLTGLALALGAMERAYAADYPTQPVRFITPAPLGGGTDLVLRVFADKIAQNWGQQVLVENRPGGDAIIASLAVAKAKPDGYTLLGTFESHASNPAFKDNLPYDTVNDFVPVSRLASVPLIMLVHPSLPVKSPQELVSLSKAKPGEITYSSIGVGSPQYMIAELFNAQTGAGMRHIPYKERSQMTSDALAGRVSVIISGIGAMVPHIKSGALRGLGVSSITRSATVPDVPTLNEAGVPGFNFVSWVGLFAPAKTPREITDKLHAELKRVAMLPDVRQKIESSGAEVTVSASPEEFSAQVRGDIQKFTKMFKK